ncbi:hydroxymethylpyrimidine/phosphomethylpyrimidine kinase/hydroxymethylpyrimidine kinase / phosphomethylpyrimidine kinase / thiamine-phosphate diphosphorylase [Micromonospora pattaloongensis]|uniref:Hydroxymethylpyrimidine/phosphomethylpyrimidine kinase/hydroxymethylpyrimidine kinase / phosphomethylpyrimidine kinase / thiamine-phosphate diphosphorylase n=1 Tax=Micromonospora pattaloongensis TaxID=405436 RepID=A0A1H3MIP7_9ACTN|nr:bifunctional hydroxymethylpyrimidine kinase/phosphomethylpyrimidine kinase [Micromonospora pattaloongensis]SDY76433.1 hydroxymethylpyrimidine/phosphomethylpyrimidine kinase/hydroxymethylpyrimidine kinase / phosphomethylpyrimidine kinase / thiamine-phosphate diphosphorylase [Micromonospora pattaloongensis]
MTPPTVLTIAGSDSGAGAGIQADLKVFASLRLYGTSVVTATTAQNTRGVQDVFPMPGNVVAAQLTSVLDDMPPRAAKVGMLATAEAAAAVAAKARSGLLPNLVIDPVLESSSGRRLGVVSAIERLLPHATVITPNREEASALVGWPVDTPADMAGAAAQLASNGPRYVVVTGGDLVAGDDAVDAVWTEAGARFLHHPRIGTRNNHGTGCTFSAAIAARLALGDAVPEALVFAKEYVARALRGARDWNLGGGQGPLDHFGWSSA